MAAVLITGSTDGLGRAAAQSLFDDGHQVVLHAQSADRAATLGELASRSCDGNNLGRRLVAFGMEGDESEIDWHRRRIGENRTLLDELEAGNEAGGEVFPETQAEIERLEAQIEQSQLIVAAYEKKLSGD